MALLDFLKKKKIPDELPDLATDEIEKKMKSETSGSSETAAGQSDSSTSSEPAVSAAPADIGNSAAPESSQLSSEKPSEDHNPLNNPSNRKSEIGAYAEELKKAVLESDDKPEASFFDGLQKDITDEMGDLDKMEDWYEHKFLPKDILSDMRNYWENQKAATVLQTLGNNFKDRINEKTKELQDLEKEWQNIYFDLVEKEEEIKDGEEELKKMLSEFVEVCKRKKGMLENKDDAQKKTEEEGKQ